MKQFFKKWFGGGSNEKKSPTEDHIEILGLVDAMGCGGITFGPNGAWHATFSIIAWHEIDQPFIEEEVYIMKEVEEADLDKYRELIKPETVVRLKITRPKPREHGSPKADMVEFIETWRGDRPLNEIKNRYQTRIEFKHADYGNFVFDRSLEWFGGTYRWGEESIDIYLSTQEIGRGQALLNRYKEVFNNPELWQNKIKDFAVDQLIQLKNDNWLEEGESPITKEAFKQVITFESISVYGDNEAFEIYLTDGDVFWGHSICVDGNLDDGFKSAGIQG